MKNTIVSGALFFSVFVGLLFFNPIYGYAAGATAAEGYGVKDPGIRAVITSAKNGDMKARFRLGLIYLNGSGVPRDYVLSYMWFNLSGAEGYKPALKQLNKLEARMPPEQIKRAQKMSLEFTKK